MIKQLKDIITPAEIMSEVYSIIVSLEDEIDGVEDLNPMIEELLVTNMSITNIDYNMNRLDKYLSPMTERLLTYYGDNVTSTFTALAQIILNRYLEKWTRISNALYSDYNPISNYDMTEKEEVDNSKTVNTSMTTESDYSSTNKFAGFNSGTSLPVASETVGDNDSTTSGLLADNKEVDDNERTLTRSGNIGVTTSQQMIQSELELRKHNLIDIIYQDIDSILFLDLYL